MINSIFMIIATIRTDNGITHSKTQTKLKHSKVDIINLYNGTINMLCLISQNIFPSIISNNTVSVESWKEIERQTSCL